MKHKTMDIVTRIWNMLQKFIAICKANFFVTTCICISVIGILYVAFDESISPEGSKSALAVWTVVKVSDGDTVWVKDGGERVKVRLDKIDAPESDQKWGKESREALSQMVMGREVELKGDKTDRYGRRLSVIWCEGKEVNLELVKLGLAWHYAYHDKTEAYREAEAEARREKRGLWKDENPINPYEWRKRKRK